MTLLKTRFSLHVYKTVWPICLGYIPLGLACGVFAQKAGLSLAETLGLCVILYAGSGQFICIAMIAQAASAISIALTIFIVNLRHFLFSSILARYLREKSTRFLAIYAYEVTDESFAVNLTAFERGGWSPDDARSLNLVAHLVWTGSNITGFIGAGFIAIDIQLVGYALTAMFIGLWSLYLSNWRMIIAGFGAGVLATVLSRFVGYKLHIVLAAVATSALLAFYEVRQRGNS